MHRLYWPLIRFLQRCQSNMLLSAGWLLFIFLTPVLSLIPAMLLWQLLGALASVREQL